MSRSPDYDIEAADLVARTLRAVAADTHVADRDEAAAPIASLPAPVDLTARRSSRRRTRALVAGAAAAAALGAALVWVGHDPSGPSNTTDLGRPVEGTGLAPTEIQPGHIPAGLEPLPGLQTDNGVLYDTQAFLLEPPEGGQLLTVVVNWPDGRLATANELDRLAQALATLTGTETSPATITAPTGQSVGYITLPIGDVDEDVVATVHDVLVAEGVGVSQFAIDSGWAEQAVDVSWVPGLAPTVMRRYSDVGRNLDVYTAFGDIASAMVMTALMPDATPSPVGGNMGWHVTGPNGDSVVVWQAAPGTVMAVVASEALADDVPAVVESITPPETAPGEHPNWRPVGASAAGEVPWLVEAGDFVRGTDERPCMSLWVAGQVPLLSCGLTPPAGYTDTFSAVTHVDDDVTVVFGLFAPAVASVETDASGAEHARVEARPLDPDDPFSQRYAVLIIHGGREEPQTFRLLDERGELLDTRSFNLNEVGG